MNGCTCYVTVASDNNNNNMLTLSLMEPPKIHCAWLCYSRPLGNFVGVRLTLKYILSPARLGTVKCITWSHSSPDKRAHLVSLLRAGAATLPTITMCCLREAASHVTANIYHFNFWERSSRVCGLNGNAICRDL